MPQQAEHSAATTDWDAAAGPISLDGYYWAIPFPTESNHVPCVILIERYLGDDRSVWLPGVDVPERRQNYRILSPRLDVRQHSVPNGHSSPSSHELARRILALPELPPIAQNDCVKFRLVAAFVDDSASWSEPTGWVEKIPAVVIADYTDATTTSRDGGGSHAAAETRQGPAGPGVPLTEGAAP